MTVNAADWQVIQQCVTINNIQNLPTTVINYVFRTQEIVVINDATNDKRFKSDSYLISHQVKSALCIPIISQGNLISIIYLENNLISGAFTFRVLG